MKKYLLVKAVLLLITCHCKIVSAQQISFPGAEGTGKFTSGGRGTAATASTVFEVTKLDDDGSVGTLRYALTASGTYRTIVFRISGTIHLTSPLKITKANTTIAGQTAPGDGICLADYPFSISADNVIVRYIRFRMGDKNQNLGKVNGSGNDDSFGSSGRKNIIVDHCTMSWSADEACSVYSGDSTTLQWNLISEPLNYSYHFESGDADYEQHAYGGIWGGQHVTFHHNLFAHLKGRVPRFDGSRNLGDNVTPGLENADFRNNVLYDWGSYNTNGGSGGNYNIVNNYYKYGPSTSTSTASGVAIKYMIIQPYKDAPLPYGKYYVTGNYVDGSAATTARNWLGAAMNSSGYADTTVSQVNSPFSILSAPTQTATDAYESVLAGAGVILPNRDTLDARIVNDVINRTGKLIDVQGGYPHGTAYALTVNAWPTLNSTTAPTDTDHDGMPDEWETQRGLNPNSNTDRNSYNTNGFTNLEIYLNGDSIVATGTANTCVAAKKVTAVNSGSWLNLKDTTYTRLVSTDSTNMVVSILDNASLGAFNASYYVSSTNRTYNGQAYLNRNITLLPVSGTTTASPVTVRFYFTAAEFNALKLAFPYISTVNDLKLYVSADNSCVTSFNGNGSSIAQTANAVFGTYQNGYYVQFTTSTFGTFFVTGNAFTLPLNLLSFNGSYTNKNVELTWQTSNEVNVDGFTIERSNNGNSFTAIGTVKANNTSAKSNYSFTDYSPLVAVSYYRLRMTDKDGSFTYSAIVTVNTASSAGIMAYPNPVKNNLVITHAQAGSNDKLEIVGIDGKILQSITITPFSNQTKVDVSKLANGSYLARFVGEAKRLSIQFVKE